MGFGVRPGFLWPRIGIWWMQYRTEKWLISPVTDYRFLEIIKVPWRQSVVLQDGNSANIHGHADGIFLGTFYVQL